MQNARPHNQAGTSAHIQGHSIPGTVPRPTNTVTAAVLAALLEGQTLTGMEAVFGASTTRLAALVHYPESKYGWCIERREIATGTNGGRVAWITAYWLSQATGAIAFEQGARSWIDQVKADRLKQRQKASRCRVDAARINAARRFEPMDARRGGLWEAL